MCQLRRAKTIAFWLTILGLVRPRGSSLNLSAQPPFSLKNPTAVGFGVGKSFLIADCTFHSIVSSLDIEHRVLSPSRQRRVAFLKGDWSLCKMPTSTTTEFEDLPLTGIKPFKAPTLNSLVIYESLNFSYPQSTTTQSLRSTKYLLPH